MVFCDFPKRHTTKQPTPNWHITFVEVLYCSVSLYIVPLTLKRECGTQIQKKIHKRLLFCVDYSWKYKYEHGDRRDKTTQKKRRATTENNEYEQYLVSLFILLCINIHICVYILWQWLKRWRPGDTLKLDAFIWYCERTNESQWVVEWEFVRLRDSERESEWEARCACAFLHARNEWITAPR